MGTVETAMTPVSSLVDMVHTGALKLPEIQRDYVWRRPQVRDLLDSLYRGYPVGTVLVWQTDGVPYAREAQGTHAVYGLHATKFLLDGQQRLTSLAGVMKTGRPDIRFNFETEEFQVGNAAINRDPRWIPVSDVFQSGPISVATDRKLLQRADAETLLRRLSRLEQIRQHLVPVHVLANFDYQEVTDIFVRVNSKGTRLREAELAIARLAFKLPGMVTDELKTFEEDLDRAGYEIDLRFLMRCLTAVATGQSRFGPLGSVGEDDIRKAWEHTRQGTEHFVNLLRQNLGIESAGWLPSMNAIVVPVAYLSKLGHQAVDAKPLLRWFLLASMWQRYAGSAETTLDQDLRALGQSSPFDSLTQTILQGTGRLEVTADDLDDAGVLSPFFIAVYLACRHAGAEDWWTGVRLSSTNLGTAHLLELHHVFPKAIVSNDHPKSDVNELANIAFVSQVAHRPIGKSEPAEYLAEISEDRLRKQFIPLDRELWKLGRFQEFLQARRELIAAGINEFLNILAPQAAGV